MEYSGVLSPEIRRKDEETIKRLAPTIKDNKELRLRLRQANPALRKGVYDMLLPHLKFKALPFWALNR